MAPSRVRSYCFTQNNPSVESEQQLERVPGYTYLTFGREVAPTTGTRHLQGYIRFANGKSVAAARRLLIGCHVERAITVTAAIEYCHKDGDFVEFGVRPQDDAARGDGEVHRWETAWTLAKEGRVEEVPVDIRVRCYGTLRRIEKDFMVRPGSLGHPCGVWVYGESGVGKTSAVYSKYPNLYTKNCSKWWDGYQGEDVVLFDDMDPDVGKWSGRFFKIWTDERPFIADIKGGSISIRPGKFIVTSQYTIEECFADDKTRVAVSRRCLVINFLNREINYEF